MKLAAATSAALDTLATTALFLFFFGNCKNATNAPALNGHARMIEILDSIYATANPMECYNLNGRKAALIKQQMDRLTGYERLTMQVRYAEQLLNAGKNEAATLELLTVTKALGDKLEDQSKVVYELLALSYMRLGEQQNCINSHTAESCILPIQDGGIYKMPSGPVNAMKIYERILAAYPDDVQSRWLLNLAAMTLGKWPAAVPAAYRLPASIFQTRSNIRFRDMAIPLGLDARGISGGVSIEDFDGDLHLDVFVTSYGLHDQARFFHNNGDGTFTERTREANLMGIVSGLNTLHADYDNDGDRDILILRGAWLAGGTHPNSLLQNDGKGVFTDVTIAAGLLSFHPTQAADWADYDGDGWLDLYIANETLDLSKPHRNELYHNNQNGTFTNVAAKLGVDYADFYKAAVWGDINNDQRPDLYISNLEGDNHLLLNLGGTSADTWKFEDIAPKVGLTNPQSSFPAFFFDYNNDGWDDIFVTDFTINPQDPTATPLILDLMGKQPVGDWARLYRNNGGLTPSPSPNGEGSVGEVSFTDVHREMGLHMVTYAMGNNFGDFDNDGWLDIYLGTGKPDLRTLMPNRAFHNLGGERFEDISMNGFGHIQKGHGVAFADMDNDGDQDIYAVMGGAYEGDLSNNLLFENPGNANAWVTLFLEGKTCNRDAMGAKIKVNVVEKGGKKRMICATVGTGGSFGSSSLRQEIGLGQAEKIESVEVMWPKPGVPNSVYTNVPLNAASKLTEGNAVVEAVGLTKVKWKG